MSGAENGVVGGASVTKFKSVLISFSEEERESDKVMDEETECVKMKLQIEFEAMKW